MQNPYPNGDDLRLCNKGLLKIVIQVFRFHVSVKFPKRILSTHAFRKKQKKKKIKVFL